MATELAKKKRTPRDLLRVIFRRWHLFLLSASLLAAGVMIAAHYWPPLRYTGSTRFLRRTDSATRGVGETQDWKEERRTLRYDLTGYHALANAAEELGLVRGPYGPDGKLTPAGEMAKQELINDLIGSVGVRFNVRSIEVDLITISFTHEDPELAEKMPNTLVNNYINRISQIIVDRLTGSLNFLEKQAKLGKQELLKLADKKNQFEIDHAGVMFDSPGQLRHQILQVSATADMLRIREKELSKGVLALEQYMAEYERLVSSTQPTKEVIEPNPRRVELENQLQATEQRVVDLQSFNGMKDKHPTIIFLRRRIEYLKEQIAKEPKEVVRQKIIERKELPRDRGAELYKGRKLLAATRKNIQDLEERERALDKALANFSTTRQEYLDLLSQVKEKTVDLAAWSGRLREVRVSLEAELSKRGIELKTVELAQKQTRPSSPSLGRVLALAILGGLAFGGGLVLLSNLMDRSISTTEEATKHFNIPVHGVIGEIVTRSQRSRRRLARWVFTPIASLAVASVLFLCGLSIYLYLRHPEIHKAWKAEPVGYLVQRVTDVIE